MKQGKGRVGIVLLAAERSDAEMLLKEHVRSAKLYLVALERISKLSLRERDLLDIASCAGECMLKLNLVALETGRIHALIQQSTAGPDRLEKPAAKRLERTSVRSAFGNVVHEGEQIIGACA